MIGRRIPSDFSLRFDRELAQRSSTEIESNSSNNARSSQPCERNHARRHRSAVGSPRESFQTLISLGAFWLERMRMLIVHPQAKTWILNVIERLPFARMCQPFCFPASRTYRSSVRVCEGIPDRLDLRLRHVPRSIDHSRIDSPMSHESNELPQISSSEASVFVTIFRISGVVRYPN